MWGISIEISPLIYNSHTWIQFEEPVKNGVSHTYCMVNDIFHAVTKKCAECVNSNDY